MSLKSFVEQRLKDIGRGPSEAAKAGGLTSNFITDIIYDRKRSVRGENLQKLAQALQCSTANIIAAMNGEIPFIIATPNGTALTTMATIRTIDVPTIAPHLLNFTLNDGDERFSSPNSEQNWDVPMKFIRNTLRAAPSDLRVVEVQGDSMMPSLYDGDLVFINTQHISPSPSGIFAIWDGVGVVVKRVEIVPQHVRPTVNIISDNKNYAAHEVPIADIQIIGRVCGKVTTQV